jgi:long-chain acyl-CoA synthetase
LMPNEFSIDGGEITPTMKIKRKNVVNKYQSIIEGMYP